MSAVDPSPGQLDFARRRPAAELAQFSLGDAQALPFPDRSFDAAAMALVITFIPDPAKAVAEMARVVRPGGVVATYMWDTLNGGVPLTPIETALKAIGKPPPTRASAAASGRDAMQAFWQAAGLQSIEMRQIRIPVAYASFDDFCEFEHRADRAVRAADQRPVAGRAGATQGTAARATAHRSGRAASPTNPSPMP